jgi:hypothetical protein
MRRSVGTGLALCLMVGCRAPAPTFDPFAPYGPRRVPPPATGSIGESSGYYQPPAQPLPAAPPSGASVPGPMQAIPSLGTTSIDSPRPMTEYSEGAWQSAAQGYLAAPATEPARVVAAGVVPSVAASGPVAAPVSHQLSWTTPTTGSGAVVPARAQVGLPTAAAPLAFSSPGTFAYVPAPVPQYASPLRPSIVRSTVPVVYYDYFGMPIGSGVPCCSPAVAQLAGPPVSYAYPNAGFVPYSGDQGPHTESVSVPDGWQPRE